LYIGLSLGRKRLKRKSFFATEVAKKIEAESAVFCSAKNAQK
jgi:hypothetical protein